MYIETPNQNSVRTLSNKIFRKHGFNVSITNFYDDKTHISPYNCADLASLFKGMEFEVISQGTICNDFLAEQLISYGFAHKDQELTTYGLWLLAEWVDYIVLRNTR